MAHQRRFLALVQSFSNLTLVNQRLVSVDWRQPQPRHDVVRQRTQKLAQTRPGALAALLYHGGVPASTFGESWPDDVALQVHLNDQDEWIEPDVAEELVNTAANAELFTYTGSAHLFTDSSLDDYDPGSANLVLKRTVNLLSRWP